MGNARPQVLKRRDCAPPRSLLAAGCLSSAVLVLFVVVGRVPQGLFSDPAWQLKAVQQYIQGISPTANTLTMPDPSDLSRDLPTWISWWAPGTEILAFPLMRLGATPGSAIRIIAIVCLIGGTAGWAWWISAFNIPRRWQFALVTLLPWTPYAHNSLFLYSAETLAFGAVPWALLLTLRTGEAFKQESPSALLSAVVGLVLGTLYLLKYSAVFVGLGALAYAEFLALESWRAATENRTRVLVGAGCLFCTFCAPIVALSALNRAQSGTINLLDASILPAFRWQPVLMAIANPALAIGDADALLRFILLHPAHGLIKGASELWLGVAALPAGLMLAVLLLTQRFHDAPVRLAYWVLGTSVVCILAAWTLSDGVSYEARHLAGASIATLPLALQAGERAWLTYKGWPVRAALAGIAVAFIVLPLSYGVPAAIAKLGRQSAQTVGPSHIYNPLFAESNINVARELVLRGFNEHSDIWYVTDPITALDLPGRLLIVHADFITTDVLRRSVFETQRPVRIRALLPRSFVDNGKADLIKASFRYSSAWTVCPTDGLTRCWTAQLDRAPRQRSTDRARPDSSMKTANPQKRAWFDGGIAVVLPARAL